MEQTTSVKEGQELLWGFSRWVERETYETASPEDSTADQQPAVWRWSVAVHLSWGIGSPRAWERALMAFEKGFKLRESSRASTVTVGVTDGTTKVAARATTKVNLRSITGN